MSSHGSFCSGLWRVGAQGEAKDRRGSFGGVHGDLAESQAVLETRVERRSTASAPMASVALCRARGVGRGSVLYTVRCGGEASTTGGRACVVEGVRRRRGWSDGMDGSVAANGRRRAEYGGDVVGWAARVGSLGPWVCGAWRRGTGRADVGVGAVGPAVAALPRCPGQARGAGAQSSACRRVTSRRSAFRRRNISGLPCSTKFFSNFCNRSDPK
jgi:hypothetical protein